MTDAPVAIAKPELSPEVKQLVAEAMQQPSVIDNIIVETMEQATAAAELLRGLKTKAATLTESRFAITRPMDEAKAAVMDLFRVPLDCLATAETRLKGKLGGFQRQQEQAEIQRRQQAQREADEAERVRREAEADAERLAAEGAPVEDVIAALDKVEATASVAETASVVAVAAQYAPVSSSKVAGISSRSNWKAEVVDLLALVKAAAANPDAFLPYLQANEQAIGAFARSAKSAARMPGVEFRDEKIIAGARK
jgi:hypothetical protein